MRRNKAGLRGRIFPILAAGLIGYLIGGWHPGALRASSDPSAADAVALRFPQAWQKASPTAAAAADALPESGVLHDAGITTAAPANVGDAQLALLDPAPMIPPSRQQPIAQTALDSAPPPPLQFASAEAAAPSVALDSDAARPLQAQPVAATRSPRPEKSAAAKSMMPTSVASKSVATVAPRRPMDRPGYMLDDAQIASIKERLHLTPDQEQMWPAVEAALRNIAYTRAQQARSRGAGIVQTGDIDPASVDNLKSAAVPLIMSFNDDQKQEVRNLAHVMGLDQLASEF